MTKREKTIRDLRNRIARMEAQREAAIKTLVRVEATLPKLRNQLRRLTARDRKLMEKEVALGYIATRQAVETQVESPPEPEPKDDGSDPGEIPSYLLRSPLAPDIAKAAYAVANKHNKLPTEGDKKLVAQEKRKVKQEHRHAELTGKTRKWPATGKAAAALLK